MTAPQQLRSLPPVDAVLQSVACQFQELPRTAVLAEIRRVLERRRIRILQGLSEESHSVEAEVQYALHNLAHPSLKRVINATGVILHTNLGRAPLPVFVPIRGYANLEYDLDSGKRGKRDVHVSGLLERILGKAGIVVNNN